MGARPHTTSRLGGRTLLLAVALLLALPAFGADLSSEAAIPLPAFTWAGFYIGANIGGALTPANPRLHAIGFPSSGFDLVPGGGPKASFTGGLQAGYNFQVGPYVMGFETDFGYLGNCRSGTFAAPPAYELIGVGVYGLSGGCSSYFGTVRGRFGVAFDRVLLYATAGLAFGGDRNAGSIRYTPPGPVQSFDAGPSDSTGVKHVLGAGLEYALTDHWLARVEYLYANLGRPEQIFGDPAGRAYSTGQVNANHVFRLGLSYKLDPDPPATDSRSTGTAPLAPTTELASFHGQITWLPQAYPNFRALYSGPQSLPPEAGIEATGSVTAYLGLGLWQGGGAYLDPEIDQGFGVGDTLGIAGFPSNEAFKVGRSEPYVRLHRYFLRQVIGLGGDPETIGPGQNQLAGSVDSDRLTFTIGKYAVTDVFDDNTYAHDGRNGFMNWTINAMGAFDYAADSWGYTFGGSAEWKQDRWTLRAGLFQLSTIPNGQLIEPVPFRQFESVVELEERHVVLDQPGKVRFLFFANDGFFGSYNQALAQAAISGTTPSLANVRARRVKVGGGINVEQQITPSLGFFGRLSMASGQYESYDFTEVERSLSAGFVSSGDLWGRSLDQVGIACVLNGITNAHASYLAAGGLGIILGDGALSYSGEHILEAYYRLGITDGIHITADYQFVDHPGYNRARGPVSLMALRFHAEF